MTILAYQELRESPCFECPELVWERLGCPDCYPPTILFCKDVFKKVFELKVENGVTFVFAMLPLSCLKGKKREKNDC